MGSFNIFFEGICTHFTENIPVPYRVVLVNASRGLTVKGIPIPAHRPFITFPDSRGNQQEVTLNGVNIQVGNPQGRPMQKPTLPSLPNLTTLMSAVEPLSPRSPQYVLEEDPDLVACHFDFTVGTATVKQNESGAFGVEVNVPTTMAQVPELTLSPFSGSTLPEGLTPTMKFGTDVNATITITISNLASPSQEMDSGAHFLLHYLTASQMPGAPQVPQMPTVTQNASRTPSIQTDTVGGDCSNSVYP